MRAPLFFLKKKEKKKKKVLRLDLKTFKDERDLISYGSPFHTFGPECEKAASLLEKLHLGGIFKIKKSSSSLELLRLTCLRVIISFK